MKQEILFSGIQPTGKIHLGNYLGAIKQWIDLQDKYNSLYCVVDLHALTINQDPKTYGQQILDAAMDIIALGLNPKKLFIQSHVPAHAELAWYFNTLTPVGELFRMTQFKDKSGIVNLKRAEDIANQLINNTPTNKKERDNLSLGQIYILAKKFLTAELKFSLKDLEENKSIIENFLLSVIDIISKYQDKEIQTLTKYNADLKKLIQLTKEHHDIISIITTIGSTNTGLLTYPSLMAADILLYHATVVPVGQDQVQHLELTNILVKKFNNKYGTTFAEVKPYVTKAAKIMALNEPTKKMSKSLGDAYCLYLNDTEEIIRQKVSRAVTDSGPAISGQMSEGVKNLFFLLELLGDKKIHNKLLSEYNDKTIKYSELKNAVADSVVNFLKPFWIKRAKLAKNPKAVLKTLTDNGKRVAKLADKNLTEIKKKIGLI